MMLLCAVPPHTHSSILFPFHCFSYSSSSSKSKAPSIFYSNHSSRSSDTAFTFTRPNVRTNPSSPSPSPVHQSSTNGNSSTPDEQGLVPSAAAIAAAIRRSSASPVEIVQRIARDGNDGLVLPSPDFCRLCVEQLDLFRAIVDPVAVLSVYVRPAGSYVMDQLELRRVTLYPGTNGAETAEVVILIGNFGMPTGLRAAEAVLSNNQVQVIPECQAVVFPMVKHPFVVGFLVAELPMTEFEQCVNVQKDGQGIPIYPSLEESYGIPSNSDRQMWEIQTFKEDWVKTYHQFTIKQRSRAIKISRSLAMAYVMDQKAMLLQQSSWQNNVRMSNLVEQIRGPLSSIRTLSKMLSVHMKRSEISYDIIEDILVQGDRMKDTLQQLQDAVYLTKANIVRFNEETLKKMHNSTYNHPESMSSHLLENFSGETQDNYGREMDTVLSVASGTEDLQLPTPPLALAALQQFDSRPCNVSDILENLVAAAGPLALKQQRSLKLSNFLQPLQVAVEESSLRQALSNLIEGALLRTEVGGKVEIVSRGAPAGGALVVIDDDGPDMHYMADYGTHLMVGTDVRNASWLGPSQADYTNAFGRYCSQVRKSHITMYIQAVLKLDTNAFSITIRANLFTDGMVEDNMTWNFIAGLTIAREILESYGCVIRVISPRSPNAAIGAGGTRIELWLPALPSNPTEPNQEG